MPDCKRAIISSFLNNAATPEERELATALLEGYDAGELDVLIGANPRVSDEVQFILKPHN